MKTKAFKMRKVILGRGLMVVLLRRPQVLYTWQLARQPGWIVDQDG